MNQSELLSLSISDNFGLRRKIHIMFHIFSFILMMTTTIIEIPDTLAKKVGSHTTLDQLVSAYFTWRHDQFPEGDIDMIDGIDWKSYPVNMEGQGFLVELKKLV